MDVKFKEKALEIFSKTFAPSWGGDLTKINFDLALLHKTSGQDKNRMEDVPEEIKKLLINSVFRKLKENFWREREPNSNQK